MGGKKGAHFEPLIRATSAVGVSPPPFFSCSSCLMLRHITPQSRSE